MAKSPTFCNELVLFLAVRTVCYLSSDMAVRVIGADRHKTGITSLFELLQQPRLNKQVGVFICALK